MELMKFDCGGAAAVFGAARAIAKLAPEGVEVHFVVAACEVGSDSLDRMLDRIALMLYHKGFYSLLLLLYFFFSFHQNMINDRAMVPGDILIASNGKTIEVSIWFSNAFLVLSCA